MKNMLLRLAVAASATAILAACASGGGVGLPGFGDSSNGCRTVYVYRTGGGIQPVSNCGSGGNLPRDTFMAQSLTTRSVEVPGAEPQVERPGEPAAAPVTPVSAAAKATAPYDAPGKPYPGANEMLQNADMAAFMGRVRSDF